MDSRPTKRPKHQPHADYLDGSTTDESYQSPSIAIAKRREEKKEDEEDSSSYSLYIRGQFKLLIEEFDAPGGGEDDVWEKLHGCLPDIYTIPRLKDMFHELRVGLWEEVDNESLEKEKKEDSVSLRSTTISTPPRVATIPFFTPETYYDEHEGVTTSDPDEDGMDDFEKRADVLMKLDMRFHGKLHFGKVFALAVKRNLEELQPDMIRDAAIAVRPTCRHGSGGDRTLADVIRQHTPPKDQHYNHPVVFAFDDLIHDKDLVREENLLRSEKNVFDKSHDCEPSYLECLVTPQPFIRHDPEELCHRCCENKPGWRYNGRVCHGAIFCEAMEWCEYCQSPGYLYDGVCCPIVCEWYHEKCIEKRRSLELERLVFQSRHDPPYVSWF